MRLFLALAIALSFGFGTFLHAAKTVQNEKDKRKIYEMRIS